jgi:cytochrome o ubiquinol oxidase subunit 3
MVCTFVLGLGFVMMELSEFRGMVAQGAGPDRSGFLSAFFTLVGTHGAHVSFGLIWILIMMVQISVKGLTAPVMSRLSRLGLFWHFLDLVWIGIFSVVYLLGMM